MRKTSYEKRKMYGEEFLQMGLGCPADIKYVLEALAVVGCSLASILDQPDYIA